MMVALPPLVLILAVLACRLRRQNWATCLVIAASFWAAYLVLFSESLSLVRGLQPTWVALSWLIAWNIRFGGFLVHPIAEFGSRRSAHSLIWNR